MLYPSSQSLYQLQMKFMNQSQRLVGLFDLFQARPCFSVPSNEPAINLENITFGPNQYTIEVSDLMASNMRIIYYCLLYYAFQRNPQNQGLEVYRKLLNYIQDHKLTLKHQRITLEEAELKSYYARFFYELFKAKCKRKLIIEELSTLPQMDLLMRYLIQSITGENDLVIQINASEIQKSLLEVLGFEMEFLSSQIFIFQKTYVVQIRHYSQTCSFLIRHQNQEIVQKIRDEVILGNSAFFFQEINQELCGNRKSGGFPTKRRFNVIKKSTAKSIGLSSQMSDNYDENCEKEQMNFGGILTGVVEEKNLTLEDFSKKIINSLAQPLETQRHKKEKEPILEKGKQSKNQNIVNDCLTFETEPDTSKQKEHKKSGEESDLASSSVRSINSTCSYRKYSKYLNFFGEKYNFSLRSKKHKDSFASTVPNRSFVSSGSLPFSYSTHLLKQSEFNPEKGKKVRRERRVPTFILNRQKEKLKKKQKIRRNSSEYNNDWQRRNSEAQDQLLLQEFSMIKIIFEFSRQQVIDCLIGQSKKVVHLLAVLQHIREVLTIRYIVVTAQTFAEVVHFNLAGVSLGLLLRGLLLLSFVTMGRSSHDRPDSLMSHFRACPKGHPLHDGASNA